MIIEENKVYNMDCLELMQEMIKQGIKADWLITDPPYGIKIEKMGFTKGARWDGNAKCMSKDYSNITNWDSEKTDNLYFNLMFQCSKNQIIFGYNYYANILPTTKSILVWDKRQTDLKDRNDFADCEYMWCSKGQARIFRYLWNGMLQGDMKNKDERFHPTQKPTQLIMQLLNYYTKENDLILDPFMGSFTTAVACHKLQRRFIGAELDKEYFDLGSKRLEAVQSQLSIFDMEEL